MSDIPVDLFYTESHEWVSVEDDGTVRVGISDNAQAMLGDLVFVELPEPGTEFSAGDACGVVESVKAASDFYAPLSGTILVVNDMLVDEPETINTDPYGDGWIFTMSLEDGADPEALMAADDYAELLEEG